MLTIRRILAVLALLLASAAHSEPLTVTTYTASEAGFLVNSHLIAGQRDAILVDAQFTLSEAAKVAKFVRDSGKTLRYILVTHGHPDHFFGLGVLQREFPDARIVASADVISDIEDYGPKAIATWKPVFKNEIPDDFVRPQPLDSASIVIEGQEIQLLAMPGGESAHATVLWIPGIRAVLTGDLAYNGVHLWLRENRPEGWLAILDRIEQLQPRLVLPGHGPSGGPEIIAANRQYIEAYLKTTQAPATKEQAIAGMKSSYPTYALPVIVEMAVPARIP